MKNKQNIRGYVLRFRPSGAKEDKYVPVYKFDIKKYKCGLKEGDKLKLKVEMSKYNKKGKLLKKNHKIGEIWTVLSGSSQDPYTLWLSEPDGNEHTWEDDKEIFESFEKIMH